MQQEQYIHIDENGVIPATHKYVKTVEIPDYYNACETVGVRVTPIAIHGAEAQFHAGGHTHYATLTGSQIASLRRRLSNGPRGVNVTKQDNYTGKDAEAEIYFSPEA